MAIGQGRKKIIVDSEINENTILKVLIEAWSVHLENIKDMKYIRSTRACADYYSCFGF